MNKISITDFSGGIQESLAPDDFSPRQSAVMKGIVPTNDRTFESQWGFQTIGSFDDAFAVHPLETQNGTYLVMISGAGTIHWCKAPDDDALYYNTTVGQPKGANNTVWTQIVDAENKGYKYDATHNVDQPGITIEANRDYRFITNLVFELTKYIKTPDTTAYSGIKVKDNFAYDKVGTSVSGVFETTHSVATGVLIHCRRYYDTGQQKLDFGGRPSGTTTSNYNTQVAIVCYVDPYTNTVKAATFPNLRRWPWYYNTTDGKAPDTTAVPTQLLKVSPWISSFKHEKGAIAGGGGPSGGAAGAGFITEYPFPASFTGYPRFMNVFHPYTYLDANKIGHPGRGFIPRANVGTSWGDLLILGDIEYQKEDVSTAATDFSMKPDKNTAMLGTSTAPNVLRDGSTAPHRGEFYYSEGEIDVFDPTSVILASGTDTRIAGMHVIDNRLISITTFGGENDGVIVHTGNLAALKAYKTGTANPLAIRRQVLKGGVGVDDYTDTGNGHTTQTCLWPDVGTVLFIDKQGGVYATNGQSVNRMDTYGPKQPKESSYLDHPGAVGRYAFIWRDHKLMLFTALAYSGGQASGCWTELVLPTEVGVYSNTVRSMIGSGNNLYMVLNDRVCRFALAGVNSEKGKADGVNIDITVSTASFGIPEEYTKVNWDKFGINFNTTEGCTLKSISINPGPALQASFPSGSVYNAIGSARTYPAGYQSVIVQAGIGTRPIASATYVMQGQFTLESNTFWYTGSTSNKPNNGTVVLP